jgi:small multidrug resistance pump
MGSKVSFFLLAKVLERLPIGVVYAIWSAVGISAIAILGKVVWNDPLPPLAIAGLALIVVGIVVLKVAVGLER